MKRILALILATVLIFTAMAALGTVSVADTVASQDIVAFNVSLKANVELMFAVPKAGYTVSGGKAPVEILLWESKSASGRYNYADSNAVKLQAKGELDVNGERCFIFTYNGLSAEEMSKVVYARVVYTNEKGYRTYGDLYDYSIAEFANGYLTDNSKNEDTKLLIEAMLDYGHFVALYYTDKGTSVTSYSAEEVKALKKISVTAKIGNTSLFTHTTQLAKVGTQVTLAAPHVDGATFVSWGEGVSGGKVTVKESGNEYVANYQLKEYYNATFEDAIVGSYLTSYADHDKASSTNKPGDKAKASAYIPEHLDENGNTVAASVVGSGSFFGNWMQLLPTMHTRI